jgi:hypothetical protein
MTHVLISADKCIKERWFTVNITLIARRDIGQKICSVFVRQSVTIPEGIDMYFN